MDSFACGFEVLGVPSSAISASPLIDVKRPAQLDVSVKSIHLVTGSNVIVIAVPSTIYI